MILMTLCACVKEEDSVPATGGDDIMISVKSSEGDGTDTKSTYPDGLNNYITDVNIFVFDDGGNFVSANYYNRSSGISGRELFIQDGHTYDEDFTVYIVSNVGDVHLQQSLHDRAGIDDYVYSFDRNYSTFTSKVNCCCTLES